MPVGSTPVADRPTPAGALVGDYLDYTSPDTFELFYQAHVDSQLLGQCTDYNEVLGALAWGQSYVQQGLFRMFDALGRRSHLDQVLENIDAVLATRDSVRGVTDYRGLSMPAWRAGGPFSAGAVRLLDSRGRAALELRSVRRPIESVDSVTHHALDLTPLLRVSVSPSASANRFDLTVKHDGLDLCDRLQQLTMDTVVERLHQAWPTQTLITAVDLRPSTGAGEPVPGTFAMSSQPCVYAVHTGMITYPMALAARKIVEDARLCRDAGLRRVAEGLIGACQEAVAVHDAEWRENDRGEGWYVLPRGMPTDLDGTEMPLNQSLALARTMTQLAAASGDGAYRDRARKLTRTFANQLSRGDNGAYGWSYWLDWGHCYRGWAKGDGVSDLRLSYVGATQPEDLGHGHIDVGLAVDAHRDGVLFGEADMAAFARTFTANLVTVTDAGDVVARSSVTGDGPEIGPDRDRLASGWMPMAQWDPTVFLHVDSIYRRLRCRPQGPIEDPSDVDLGFVVLGVGNLAWFANRMKSAADVTTSAVRPPLPNESK